MKNRGNRPGTAAALFVFLILLAASLPFGAYRVSAKSSVPKATVRQVKKGTSFTAGKLKYKVTSLSAKKKTVTVTGAAKKNPTKVVIPASVKITSRKGKY